MKKLNVINAGEHSFRTYLISFEAHVKESILETGRSIFSEICFKHLLKQPTNKPKTKKKEEKKEEKAFVEFAAFSIPTFLKRFHLLRGSKV